MKLRYALNVLAFVFCSTALAMQRYNCTKQIHNNPTLGGKVTRIECQQQENGCKTTKSIFPGGSSLTIQSCPAAKNIRKK